MSIKWVLDHTVTFPSKNGEASAPSGQYGHRREIKLGGCVWIQTNTGLIKTENWSGSAQLQVQRGRAC